MFLPLRVEFTGIVAREKPVNLGQVSWPLMCSISRPLLVQVCSVLNIFLILLIVIVLFVQYL